MWQVQFFGQPHFIVARNVYLKLSRPMNQQGRNNANTLQSIVVQFLCPLHVVVCESTCAEFYVWEMNGNELITFCRFRGVGCLVNQGNYPKNCGPSQCKWPFLVWFMNGYHYHGWLLSPMIESHIVNQHQHGCWFPVLDYGRFLSPSKHM